MSLTLRTAVSALLLASSAGIALAQQPGTEKASAPSAATSAPKGAAMAPAPSASATLPAGVSSYRSAFEGYRSLNDQPVLPWRESNDVVGRIGGWQSYAREGQGGAEAGRAETPAPMAPVGSSVTPPKAPVKIPASRPGTANPSAPPNAAIAPAAASAAMPGDHSGHQKP